MRNVHVFYVEWSVLTEVRMDITASIKHRKQCIVEQTFPAEEETKSERWIFVSFCQTSPVFRTVRP